MRSNVRRVVIIGVAILLSAVTGCASEPQRDVMVVRRGGDLIGVGDSIRVTDSIPGDVMLAGGDLRFSGATGGDYLVAGGNHEVSGRVHGSARIAGGNVVVNSAIDRNATIASGNLELRERSVVEGNAYLAAGNIVVAGTVRQMLRATAGAVHIRGSVGDANVSANRLRVGPRARIEGDLRYRVPVANVQIDSAATITGQVIALPLRDWAGLWFALRLLWGLAFLVAGAVLVALFPRVATIAADGLRARPGVAAGLGVMWLILLPIVIGLVTVTVIGVPLAMLLLAAYLMVLYLAGVVLALALGRVTLRDWVGAGGRGRLVAAFLLGGVALLIASWIPVVGGLAILVAIVLGSGALLMPVVRRRQV